MKKYQISFYENGVKITRVVVATDKNDALQKGFALFDAEDLYVCEI